ncbi:MULTISPECIES: hypothetical protein [Mycobacterium ulcerans group]|uniref:Uncharacterized protein n=3 Tax=Mycobacterium ulcerans group TaxID=2993898 RepID=B2HR99_MYCMM|nr:MULTISPECIES: hypothetical protein [Mycobacterium ulcerans group]ULL11760.1 hypothetical protein CKW46_23020 [Mycobacterium liflandii]ACC42530.1 conserved hypothetical protein [Mycobacterium marinum M]AGC63867.1 hypothetical protein MULP_04288 [Mycobacterium liflandii 128FXT]AXN46047.1 hypothetical protein MM1218R_04129 [Mycobacterium marinum]AXN51471.1 hypothetical protein CCUG20998_04084 [Mycobacterium marinum]
MTVGASVKQSLEQWDRKMWDVAMLHACNAVDDTSRKRYPSLGAGTRFRRVIRDAVDIYGVMATPGVDLENTRFPVAVRSDLTPEMRPDIADVLYGIHRWLHGHDEESATGFEVSPYVNGSAALRVASDGKIQLPKTAILGLLAIAVFAPENKGEVIPPDYQLSWFDHVFFVSAWWGWQDHFREIVNVDRSSLVALDFGNSWSDWAPVG